MKHFTFSLKWLVMSLLLGVSVGAAAASSTKEGSWDLTKESTDWTGSGYVTYFSQPYGFKKQGAYIMNKSISDFSTEGTTSIKVGVKSLQNGGTTSVLTVYLVDKDGNTLGTGQTISPINQTAASKTAFGYVTFTSNLAGAYGFKVECTTYGKNILINGASYVVTYSSEGGGEGGEEKEPEPTPASTDATVTFDFATNIFNLPVGSEKKVTKSTSYTYNGYTITLAASTGFYYNTGYMMLGKANSTLTFPAFPFAVEKIKVYGNSSASANTVLNIFVGDKAVSTAVTGSNKDHEFEIAADYQAAGNVYVFKVTNAYNAQITKIEIFGYETATIGTSEYATFVPTQHVAFTDVKASVITDASNYATLETVSSVPSGTPVILQGTEGTYKFSVLPSAPTAPEANLLQASDGTVKGNGSIYVLADGDNGVGFYPLADGDVLPAGKAYLEVTEAAAKAFIGFHFGDANAIEGVTLADELNAGRIYNLNGQRLGSLQKGLNIVNGKKVFIK